MPNYKRRNTHSIYWGIMLSWSTFYVMIYRNEGKGCDFTTIQFFIDVEDVRVKQENAQKQNFFFPILYLHLAEGAFRPKRFSSNQNEPLTSCKMWKSPNQVTTLAKGYDEMLLQISLKWICCQENPRQGNIYLLLHIYGVSLTHVQSRLFIPLDWRW